MAGTPARKTHSTPRQKSARKQSQDDDNEAAIDPLADSIDKLTVVETSPYLVGNFDNNFHFL